MTRQDQQFLKAVEKMNGPLLAKFYKLAKNAGIREDKMSFAEDLRSLTILEALIYSRRWEGLDEVQFIKDCITLMKIKANNVWAEYWRSRANQFHQFNVRTMDVPWAEEFIPDEGNKVNTRLEDLLNSSLPKARKILEYRLENYSVNEIARMHSTTPGAITMEIQRLKKKISTRL
jgi:DNA-directed RNA polymerase specialized sigma24 family protein